MRLTLFLDHDCNLRCSYCYNGRKFARPMTLELAWAAIDRVLFDGHPLTQLGFFGGEPLLHRALMADSVAHARQQTVGQAPAPKYVVTTNGTLLDDATVAWLVAEGFHVGLSIDGTPEAHDAARRFTDGRGSYAAVAAGLARVLGAGLPLRTVTVVGPLGAARMGESLAHLLALGVRDLSFNLDYEADWDEPARATFEEGLAGLVEAYLAAYRAGTAFRFNLLDRSIVTHLKGGYEACDRCDFGCEELAVSPSGKLYPCDRLVGEDDREDVLIGTVAEGVDLARRDALIASKNLVLDECLDCGLLGRCMHWCGCVNHAMTGSVGGVSGLLCWFERRLIAAADRAGAQLYAETNPTFLRRFYRAVL